VGGYANANPSSTELYNPVTGVWTVTGPLNAGRNQHTATLLPNGKVLVAGGNNGSYPYTILSSAELYDPVTGTWASTGSLITTRCVHTATLLPNGKVLIAGGDNGMYSHTGLSSAELYDSLCGTATAVILNNTAKLPSGAFQFAFTNKPSVSFSVLAATNASLSLSNWTMLGGVIELWPGQYQFTDPQAPNSPQRFYRIRSP
jgi:hypothetical protein